MCYDHHMIYWFFGYPGIGKDFVAKKFAQKSKILYVNGDSLLTATEKRKLASGTFSREDRLLKLKRISKYLKSLKKDLAITDSLPDNQSRIFLLNTFKDKISFILVQASTKQHLQQIHNRKKHFFKPEMVKIYIEKNWEPLGEFPHTKIKNNPVLKNKTRS